jgi:hypothetical protein
MTTTRFTYVGPPAYAGALAQELETQGLSADYAPPYETKDLATAMAAVSVVFSVTGSLPDIVSCVRAFTSRVDGTSVQGLPLEQERTIRERLAAVDKLRDDGVVTSEEHAEQRERILSEL